MTLYLYAAEGYRIENEDGKEHTVAQAKALFLAGKIEHYNITFDRLQMCDFDLNKVKAFYQNAYPSETVTK